MGLTIDQALREDDWRHDEAVRAKSRTDQEFEDGMIQWAALKPTDVSRVFHAKTFEMMQLRADCAVNYHLMIDTFFATDQLDLAIGRHAADLCDEADRVYLDVRAEGRKVDKVMFK